MHREYIGAQAFSPTVQESLSRATLADMLLRNVIWGMRLPRL